ncbi:uncharacterized protein LOC127079215 [Lathyrus oleraceus]|uniref:uncharacterized protein LOC127079215 n=1 Tax=Pisum sativum TaxID=3888 RepID=UPI0021D3DCA7|nr:uncharacterized protein LOC127079215 [Pisum sativum]
MEVWNGRFFDSLLLLILLTSSSCNNLVLFCCKNPPKKAAHIAKKSIEAREEDTSKGATTKTSRKPPLTPKKRKLKEPKVEAIESDDDDLSLDTFKPTKQRKKKQLKLQGALVHLKVKTSKAKKSHALKIPGAESGPKSKETLEQMESDNSSPRVEGPKVVAGSSQHPTVKPTDVTILLESSGAPTCHPTTPVDSEKGYMGEVNNVAAEIQEDSPPKTITQHSHTSGFEYGDEQDEDVLVEKDAKMQDAGEISEDESEDGSPETSQGMGDHDDEEEEDPYLFNFDIEPPEDEDEGRNDDGDEERNVREDRQTPE